MTRRFVAKVIYLGLLAALASGVSWLGIKSLDNYGLLEIRTDVFYLPLLWFFNFAYFLVGLIGYSKLTRITFVVFSVGWVLVGWIVPYALNVAGLSLLTKLLSMVPMRQLPLLDTTQILDVALSSAVLCALGYLLFAFFPALLQKKTTKD